MADGWTRGFDMSGIAFDEDRTATLITPRHVVMAAHFARPTSSQIVFHDRYGKRVKRTIIGLAPGKADVMVGLLDEDVPSNHRAYPLPAPEPDFSRLVGHPVLVTDKLRCLFVHQVAGIQDGWIRFQHDPQRKHGWGKNLIVGDSGNPSFLIVGRDLVLIETHTTGGPGAGPFFGDPEIQSAIRSAVAMLGGGHRIRTVAIR